MNTEIISKNGSIFGKIPRKNKTTTKTTTTTMSDRSWPTYHGSNSYRHSDESDTYHHSDEYDSDDSFHVPSRGTYVGQSPRFATATSSRSGSSRSSREGRTRTRTLLERLSPPSQQTEASAAISRHREQTSRTHRPTAAAREDPSITPRNLRENEREQQRLRLPDRLERERAPTRRRNHSNPGSDASSEPVIPSPVSPASSSSSSRSSSSGALRSSGSSRSSPIVGEPSYLGSVTRGFLRSARLTRIRDHGKDHGLAAGESESFFPTPKVTFMIDRPQGLTCQICQTATLEMSSPSSSSSSSSSSRFASRSSSSSSSDGDNNPDSDTRAVLGRGNRHATVAPTILPCGHLGCHNCLEQWVSAHQSCPWCRQDMVHKGCGHTVEPRSITYSTVHNLPRTIPEGGAIGSRCRDCRIEDAQTAALRKWEELAEDLHQARRRVRELASSSSSGSSSRGGRRDEKEAAKKALKQAEMAFEAAPSRSLLDKVAFVDASW